MNHYLDLILIPVQIIIVIYTIYYIVLAAFGMWRRKEKKNYSPKNTFAVIICAHNEEAVVGQLIKNLHDLDYPDDMYDIFVVADNCTDSTAQVAEAAGAQVYVRENKVEVGKGYAMGWMFDRVEAMDRKCDAYIIFDADNLVHPQFLREMNHHLEKGESVIQGYLNAKNPTDSWVAGTFSIMFWTVNHMWHLAKYNVGLSTALGGTGMCIRTDIIRKYGWDCNSLTEDMEFSMKLLSHGVRTCWAHDAIIYDEKVTGFMASCRQRLRWAQGQFDTAGRYIPILFAVGIKKGSIRILDGIIQVSQPYFLLLTTIYMIISTINSELINYWGPEHELYTNILFQVIPVGAWQIIWFLQYAFPLVVLLQIKVPPKCWFYYLIYPIFVYSWIPVNILGFIRRHDKRWSHTAHTRAVAMGDVKLTRMGDMHHK